MDENKINVEDIPIETLYKYLLKDYKRQNIEIGQLKAYIEELEYKLSNQNLKQLEEKLHKYKVKLKEVVFKSNYYKCHEEEISNWVQPESYERD